MKEFSPVILDNKEDPTGKTSSKVSQIATMFQGGGAEDDPAPQPVIKSHSFHERESGPSHASVVRTESHVARFNTARALFEKMSDQKGDYKVPRVSTQTRRASQEAVLVRPAVGRGTSLSPAPSTGSSSGRGHSRSPSPGSAALLGHIHSNGHTSSVSSSSSRPFVSALPTISTISSLSSTMSSAPSSTPAMGPSSSSIYSASPPPSSLMISDSSDRDLSRMRRSVLEKAESVPSKTKPLDQRREPHAQSVKANKSDCPSVQSSFSGVEGSAFSKMQKPEVSSKPAKPAKPEALTDRRSTHQQHQELIQRHKNWFQSFSKAKSPASSPVKSEERSLSPGSGSDSGVPSRATSKSASVLDSGVGLLKKADGDTLDKSKHHNKSLEKLQEIQGDSSISGANGDWKRDRVTAPSSRTGIHHGVDNDNKVQPDTERVTSFEELSTLPSSWCPPKQYNQTKPTPSQDDYNSKAIKDSNNALQTERHRHSIDEVGRRQLPSTSSGSEREVHSSKIDLVPLEKQAADVVVTENVYLRESYKDKDLQSNSSGASTHSNSNRDLRELPSTSDGVVLRKPVVKTKRSHEEVNFRLKESVSDANVLRHSFHREPDSGMNEVEKGFLRSNLSFDSDPEKRLKEWERKRQERERLSLEVKSSSFKYSWQKDEASPANPPELQSLRLHDSKKEGDQERSERICRIIPAGSVNVITENRLSQAKTKSKNDEVIWVKREETNFKHHGRDAKNYSRMQSSGSFNGLDEGIHYRGEDRREFKDYERKSYSLERQSKWEKERMRQDLFDKRNQEELRKKLEEERIRKKHLEKLEETQDELGREQDKGYFAERLDRDHFRKTREANHERERIEASENRLVEGGSLRTEKSRKHKDGGSHPEEVRKQKQEVLEGQLHRELSKKILMEREKQQQKESELKKQQELERQREEELERQRKALERQRIQEELHIQRQKELEKQRLEDAERQKRQELQREKLEKKRQEELERQRQEELERQRQEELERQRQEDLERQRQEKLEKQRIEEQKERQATEKLKEIERIKYEELQKSTSHEREIKTTDASGMTEDRSTKVEKTSPEAQEIARLFEERRRAASQKWEEEERIRREKDRQEILKTKQRIAELKKEREEIRRHQQYRMQQLLDGQETQEAVAAAAPATTPSPDRELPSESESVGALDALVQRVTCGSKEGEDSALQEDVCDNADPQDSPDYRESQGSPEEIIYDHTVLSAQHKIQFCVSPHGSDQALKDGGGELETVSTDTLQFQPGFSSSTISSSEYEPLPPPIPPHNVDPATLLHSRADLETSIVPAAEDEPSVMTPEEEQRLLSHNIIRGRCRENRGLLSDNEAKEVTTLLTKSQEESSSSTAVIATTGGSAPAEQPDSLDGNVCSQLGVGEDGTNGNISPLSPEETPEDSPEEGVEEGFVSRVQEVLVEDGVHYLEDGHYWVEIPGLTEEDDDDLPSTIPYHKHTKLKFSRNPIQQYTTHSITEYDRKNEDVDPVAASAEYELEKRVEKMDVFPVDIEKGEGGLGLSIIGMGVGADAGVEKLGIFVKTITPAGATDIDGRINVNDQIIEVDDQSLVGVTQAFAASVLKNTSGHVKFLIGREKDPENSEVAMLIRQSLMADRERDERRRALGGPNYDPHNGLFDSMSSPSNGSPADDTCRNNYSAHYDDVVGEDELGSCPGSPRMGSPPPEAFNHNVEAPSLGHTNEVLILRHQLQEVQQRNDMFEEEINLLRAKITDLEGSVGEKMEISKNLQETSTRLKEVEDQLQSRQAEIATYQDMLEQSQGQYIILEKKYYKAKKIIKEYQSRERDFLHREEYHINQLEEKDSHYNSLVKALKDRVIQLEGDLMKAQHKAGLPVKVPPDRISPVLKEAAHKTTSASQMQAPPRKPGHLSCLEDELSDNEGGEMLTSEDSKSSTVERKVPLKEELDVAVPPHQLLDVSASKAKSELASRGGLANRQLPSLKKTGSLGSTSSFERSLDESNETQTEPPTEGPPSSPPIPTSAAPPSTSSKSPLAPTLSSSATHQHQEVFHHQSLHSESSSHASPLHSPSSPTSSQPSSIGSTEPLPQGGRQPPPYQPPPYQPPPSAPLSHRPLGSSGHEWGGSSHSGHSRSESGGGRPEIPYRHPPPIARVQPVNRVDVSSEANASRSPQQQQQQQTQQQLQQQQQQQTLAEQLKALLSERETFGEIPRGEKGSREGSPMKKSPSSLMEDVRQAVIQADVSLGKKPVISGPFHLSSTAQVVSTGQLVQRASSPQKPTGGSFPQRISRDSGSWSPKSGRAATHSASFPNSNNSGVVLLSQRPLDPSLPPYQRSAENVGMSSEGSGSGPVAFVPGEDGSAPAALYESRGSHQALDRSASDYSRENPPVFDWTSEQVAQWLIMQGLEACVPKFVHSGITGPRLINLDAKDLKNFNLTQDEKNKIKKKVKELRLIVEKERKQAEKEKKEREKLQKKAEKLAEKAEKRKK